LVTARTELGRKNLKGENAKGAQSSKGEAKACPCPPVRDVERFL